MAKELKKVYEPQEVEDRLYAHWEELGCFKADNKSKKEPFTVVIPPPNVTGQLHMGHAMDETIQDILIRYKKLRGYETLWLPGTDHAGIATQIKVEEMLRKEGLTRYDLGREAFWKECGPGRRNTARPLSTSSRSWAAPATGAASASPWTRAARPRAQGLCRPL